MKKKRLPKSTRKFIRLEKARIRRGVLDLKEQERLIFELYKKFFKEKPQINTDFKRIDAGKNHQHKSVKSAQISVL